jgi:phosphoribosyl 1,2-cyclic phosphodiesterase
VRFASLGSGSRGNALIVEAGATRLMVDCGFSIEETERRLARLGLAPHELAGIVVTHEHGDHADGVLPFARRYGLRVWMTYGTARALDAADTQSTLLQPSLLEPEDGIDVALFHSHTAFAVNDLKVQPFPVPHDAREPVQFVISDGAARLGILTDVGTPTRHVAAMLSGCDGLILECNHDPGMLREGPYPASLKSRIASAFGHLANDAAARLLTALDRSRLKHLVAAHLSDTNNRPALARAALCGVLGCAPEWIGIADQDAGLAWRSL